MPTVRERPEGRSVRLAGLLLLIWGAVFGALHVYWALGGRAGLGETSAEAEAAFQQSWFAAYNGVVIALTAAGVALAIAVATGHFRARRSVAVLLLVAGSALLLRGVVGWVSLVATVATRGTWGSPFLLVAVEAWFLAGGLVCIVLGRRMRRMLVERPPRRNRQSGLPSSA